MTTSLNGLEHNSKNGKLCFAIITRGFLYKEDPNINNGVIVIVDPLNRIL